MQVKWLEDFVVLASSPSLFQAAHERNVTHPAFGRRIRALEEWAGVVLIERGPNGITLTPAGRTFLASASEVLDILQETHKVLQQPGYERLHKVRFAAGRTLSHSVLPHLLTRLRDMVPAFQSEVRTTSLQYGIEMLMDEEVDFLLCHTHESLPSKTDSKDYQHLVVGRDKLVAVSSPLSASHPRYRVPRTPADATVPFLDFAPAMSLARILHSRLYAICLGNKLNVVYESDLSEAIRAMVLEGAGLAWLPLSLVRRDLEHGAMVRADSTASDIDMDICLYRSRHNPKPIVRSIWTNLV